MATELGKAYVQIVPSAKGISGSITKELQGESESAGKSSGSLIASTMKKVFAAAAIGKALVSTIQAGGELQQSLGGIETLFKENADTVKKYAQEAYKTTGLGANEYMESVTGFSASLLQSLGGDTAKAAEISNMAMVDMADNSNKMGSSMDSIQNAYGGFAKQNYTMLDNLKLGYGGTKTEMERLLADATKFSGVDYNIENLNDVYEAIHVIQGEMEITGTTALEAEQTIAGSFSSMKAAFQNTLGSLALGENIGPSLEGLAQSVSTFLFGNLFPMIGTILASLPSALMVFIQAMVPAIIEMGGKLLTSLTEGVGNGFPDMLSKINELIQNIGAWIQESFPQFLQNGVDAILNLANGIMNSAPTVLTNIGNILTSVFSALLAALPTILENGFKLIAGLAKGILNNLPAVMASIIQILKNLLSKIIEHLPELLKTGVKLIVELAAGLVQAIPKVVGKIPQIISAIVKAITGLVGELIGAGKDLMLGFAKGIGDSIGAVVEKAKEAARRVVNAVKGAFRINSPSRVFMEIGEYLNLGLAKGIEDNINPVTQAMDSLESETTRDLSNNMAKIGSSYKSSANGAIGNNSVNHTGTITVKGVNDKNELNSVVEIVMDQLRREVRMA